MPPEFQELDRVVRTLPRDMAREVLNFARYLQRKHGQEATDVMDLDDDFGSRFGVTDTLDLLDRWDAIDSPASARDVA